MKMKKRNFLNILLVCFTVLVSSCGGSSSEETPEVKATSIKITSNTVEIDLGETLSFTVKDNLDVNLTSTASIYFNNSVISGSTYTPTEDGVFAIRAEYEGMISPSIYVKVNALETLSSIVVSSSDNEILMGDTVTLSAIGNEGTDFTNESIFSVDGVEISGNTYTPSKRGNEKITGTYGGFDSNEVILMTGYKQKVLIEDYTGTWCGYCPRVAYGIELVQDDIDTAVPVAIHRGSTDSSSGSYDPYNYPAKALEDYIGLSGYPTAMINRKISWSYPEPSNVNQVKYKVEIGGQQKVNNLGIKIESILAGNTLDIVVNTGTISDLNGERLVVYILENGLKFNQANYTTYYGGQSVLLDFTHDNVLRQVPTDLFGDAITSDELNATTNTYEKTFSIDLTASIENKDNLDVVAFIVNTSGEVVNVQVSKIGETKDFE